jgi:hypothetical protein
MFEEKSCKNVHAISTQSSNFRKSASESGNYPSFLSDVYIVFETGTIMYESEGLFEE